MSREDILLFPLYLLSVILFCIVLVPVALCWIVAGGVQCVKDYIE